MAKITEIKQETKPVQAKKSNLLNQGLMAFTWALLFFFCGSFLITETWTWGYRGKWTNINTYIPVNYIFSFYSNYKNSLTFSIQCSAVKEYLQKLNY